MFSNLLMSMVNIASAVPDSDSYKDEQQNIGVWQFSLLGADEGFEEEVLLTTLEERVRQAILPLLQQHTELHLVTPENLQIAGPLPTSNRILETSRALGLNYVVAGTVTLGTSSTCILKLYHVDTGILLQQQSIDVSNKTDILREVPPIIDELMLPLLRKDNQHASNVLVNFDVTPRENTLLFVDGKVQCQSLPCTIKTKEGNHNIQFHNPYYDMWAKDLYLEPTSEIHTKLTPSFGQLTVTSAPSGIQFEIDGVSMGKTPLDKHRIEKGEHEISILDPCYMGKDQNFTISNNENERIKLNATTRLAGLDVYLENPTQEAKVYVDNEYMGKTPLSVQVSMCSQTLRVENSYGIHESSLSLRESEIEKRTVKLNKHPKHQRTKKHSEKPSRQKQYRERSHSRRFNPNHSLWSTYTVNYGLESEEFRLSLVTVQIKNGWNESFIAPILPAWRAQLLDYSITGNSHQLFPIGLGYGLDFEFGLIQPYYQWHWLSIHELSDISDSEDLLTETTWTPNMHKVGVDFLLNHNPFDRGFQHNGGTLQIQSSYVYCDGGEDEFCTEELYIGASLYLLSGRWGF